MRTHIPALAVLALCCFLALPALAGPDGTAAGDSQTGRFIVHCNVEGSTVLMDGQPMGTITNGTLAIDVNTSAPRYRTLTVVAPGAPRSMIWVREGADLLYSSYGISPEMATSDLYFDGPIPQGKISSAELFLVAPSGGYSRDIEIDINKLLVNRLEEDRTPPLVKTIFSLLFPNYKGKEWSDIFSLDNNTQIGFETKEIKPYLKTENNHVAVRDQGDYMQLTNAVLIITYTPGDRS